MSEHLVRARTAFAHALAQMRRAEHLFDAPFTPEKRELLLARLGDAGDELAVAFVCAGDSAPQTAFIAPVVRETVPQAAADTSSDRGVNVVDFASRRRGRP